MEPVITWHVRNMERNTADGRVYAIQYSVLATDGTNKTGAYSSLNLDGAASVPFEQLTEDLCLQWVKGLLGPEKVQEVEQMLRDQLVAEASPTVADGVPW